MKANGVRFSAVVLFLLALQLLRPTQACAQILTSTSAGIVVAREGRIELAGRWSARGVDHPTGIASSEEQVVVLDALANEAVSVDLRSGRASRMVTAETPIAAVFLGRELYLLARDARVLQHGSTRIPLGPDPAFLRQANGNLYVYSRTTGTLEEVRDDRVSRRVMAPRFASDFEIQGATGYLLHPREARIQIIDLTTMKPGGFLAVGAVPIDLALAGRGTALTAPVLAVADPSAKRVWLQEGTQSMTQAITRGFLRGFLGLGLFGQGASQFPTGVDRVMVRGAMWIAYDSSSRTLYQFTRSTSSIVARNVDSQAFTLTPDGVAWWNGTSVAQLKLR